MVYESTPRCMLVLQSAESLAEETNTPAVWHSELTCRGLWLNKTPCHPRRWQKDVVTLLPYLKYPSHYRFVCVVIGVLFLWLFLFLLTRLLRAKLCSWDRAFIGLFWLLRSLVLLPMVACTHGRPRWRLTQLLLALWQCVPFIYRFSRGLKHLKTLTVKSYSTMVPAL